MAFKIKRVGHVVLRVKDLERSRRFFTEILGFPEVGRNSRNIFFSTDVADNHHMLAIQQAKEGTPPPDPDRAGMVHVSFELGNFAELQDAYRIFKQHGVVIHHTVFHGVAKSIYFLDPDGNMFELYCNVPPEEYRKTVPNPYFSYGAIEDELDGSVPQRPGTVAP